MNDSAAHVAPHVAAHGVDGGSSRRNDVTDNKCETLAIRVFVRGAGRGHAHCRRIGHRPALLGAVQVMKKR